MSESYDIAKAATEATLAPFTDLIQKVFGPAAEEIGLTIQDHVRVFRLGRQMRLLQKTKEILDRAAVEPGRVPLKQLAVIVENATLEEDDSLQDMWATLLANNAMGRSQEIIFAEILRQLTPADARLLRNCFNEVLNSPLNHETGQFFVIESLQQWVEDLEEERTDMPLSRMSVENLTRLGLVVLNEVYVNNVGASPRLTEIGFQFMCACEDPAVIKAAEDEIAKHPGIPGMRPWKREPRERWLFSKPQ